MKMYIALKDNLNRIFLYDKILIKVIIIKKDDKKLYVEKYEGFYSIKIEEKDLRIFYIDENSKVKPYKDFIDVTSNNIYKISNILKDSINNMNTVIEGADGTGKSTLVNELAQQGYLCQDRAIREVTQSMREEIPKDIRINNVKRYLEKDIKRNLVILYISDENVLKKRILNRKDISEYDKKAIIYQKLYLDTFLSLKKYDNIFLVDGLGKNKKQIATEVIKLIKSKKVFY